jgi:hypothetical protein
VIPALAKLWTVISLDYYGSGETTDDGSVLSLNGHSALRNGKWADVRLGHKRTSKHVRIMSALPTKADITERSLARLRR